jgi:hypothetical protein
MVVLMDLLDALPSEAQADECVHPMALARRKVESDSHAVTDQLSVESDTNQHTCLPRIGVRELYTRQ